MGDGTPGVYASVSKAVCWIDYVMSCYYGQVSGDFSSYWGYTTNICQNWMNDKLNNLYSQQTNAPARAATIIQKLIDEYQRCSVRWNEPAAPLTDVSDFERDSYGEQSQPQVQDDSYSEPLNTNNDGYSEPLTNTGDDYADIRDDSYSEPLTNNNDNDGYSEPHTNNNDDGYSEPIVKAPGPEYK